jgi:hypothetical protein
MDWLMNFNLMNEFTSQQKITNFKTIINKNSTNETYSNCRMERLR